MPMQRRQLAVWAGLVGPALFVAVFSLEGWLRPGYDPRSMFVSELALGPRGWVQAANFLIYGALLVVFAYAVAAAFRQGKASRGGPLLLAVLGLCLIASAFFVMDPAGTPREQMSLSGRLHNGFGALFFSLSPVTCLVFWRRFRADPEWRFLQGWTLAAAAVMIAMVAIMAVGPTQPPAAPNAINAWIGVVQRTALIANAAWQFAFALALRRNARA